MKSLLAVLCLLNLLNSTAQAAWPDAPWINGAPRPDALVSAVAFVSPMELQFSRITSVWKRLDKKYSTFNVNFLIVAMKESALPFNDKNVSEIAKEENFSLPIFLDYNASYAKLWRAYVSPTVNLVMRNGKVTGFDPGNFDPALFEKNLQRILKENGSTNLPARDFTNDVEAKNCGSPHSYFTGSKYESGWAIRNLKLEGAWQKDDFGILSPGTSTVGVELNIERHGVGLVAENTKITTSRVNVTLDGEKLSSEIRGRDVQEDKAGNTFISVRGAQLYEVIRHSSKMKETSQKLNLTTDSKSLKIWALETTPACQEL